MRGTYRSVSWITQLNLFGVLAGELPKQISWLPFRVTVGHWRTSNGDEVDLVAEHDDGRVIAFDVKASQPISGKDFNGLRKLRNALGSRFVAGVAFSNGGRSHSVADRLSVLPVERLWMPIPE